jgi:transportin-1
MLAEVRIDYLMPYMKSIMQFMLIASQDADAAVCLEACEFWSAIGESKMCREPLGEILPQYELCNSL